MKFNPKKNNQDRRVRKPQVKLSTSGANRHERRMLASREKHLATFSKETKARYIKDIESQQRLESIKRKLVKAPKKDKKPFISKRSLKRNVEKSKTIQ